ncbi:MAG TPA: SRPBCC family protein [Thermoanaerobaculia bacterium]|jgi:uncharacterized protein YndB with AHSA1/START domain
MLVRCSFRALATLVFGVFAGNALGEVIDLAENGFTIRNAVTVSADPAKAYTALTDGIGKWWDPDHTFSHDAANLSIDAKPQGCFCERLAGGGGVRHLTVVSAVPGKTLRLEGGLGPLQAMALAGSMTWTFQPEEKATSVELRYVVGGYNPGGFKDLAPRVDSVLRSQLQRYKRYVETGRP